MSNQDLQRFIFLYGEYISVRSFVHTKFNTKFNTNFDVTSNYNHNSLYAIEEVSLLLRNPAVVKYFFNSIPIIPPPAIHQDIHPTIHSRTIRSRTIRSRNVRSRNVQHPSHNNVPFINPHLKSNNNLDINTDQTDNVEKDEEYIEEKYYLLPKSDEYISYKLKK